MDTQLTYAFHYGIDEIDNLALFSQQSGAEVIIQVNVSNNDPYMWADMLRYTNIENDYNFKYWELGNELDHESSQGSEAGMDAATYQARQQLCGGIAIGRPYNHDYRRGIGIRA